VPASSPTYMRLSRSLSAPDSGTRPSIPNVLRLVGGGAKRLPEPTSARDAGLGSLNGARDMGDGPPKRGRPRRAVSEPMSELPRTRPVGDSEKNKRDKAGRDLELWLRETIGHGSDMLPSLPLMAGDILAAYGRDRFRRRGTVGDYAAAIHYITDKYGFMRGNLRPAWQQVRIWNDRVPTELTVPCPELVLKGATVVALTWGWQVYARYLVHSFYGCHRGCELRAARRSDLLFPSDFLYQGPYRMYTRVSAPKNQWAGPRTQHSAIRERSVIDFLARHFASQEEEELCYPFTSNMTTGRWGRVMGALGVVGLKPRSLRGGGVARLYEATEDMSKVIYQGRWTQPRNAEWYLQEALTTRLLSRLPEESQQRLLRLAPMFDRMIQAL
jgi:hypothetical protein